MRVLTKLLEVLNCSQAGLSIRNCRIHKMLLAPFIYGKALKSEVPTWPKVGGHVAGSENGALEATGLHAVLDKVKFDSDDPSLQRPLVSDV